MKIMNVEHINTDVKSLQAQLPKHNPITLWCCSILDDLILSKIGTPKGILLACEQPMGNGTMLNLVRPAVVR